jgi:hypothetical protein
VAQLLGLLTCLVLTAVQACLLLFVVLEFVAGANEFAELLVVDGMAVVVLN